MMDSWVYAYLDDYLCGSICWLFVAKKKAEIPQVPGSIVAELVRRHVNNVGYAGQPEIATGQSCVYEDAQLGYTLT